MKPTGRETTVTLQNPYMGDDTQELMQYFDESLRDIIKIHRAYEKAAPDNYQKIRMDGLKTFSLETLIDIGMIVVAMEDADIFDFTPMEHPAEYIKQLRIVEHLYTQWRDIKTLADELYYAGLKKRATDIYNNLGVWAVRTPHNFTYGYAVGNSMATYEFVWRGYEAEKAGV